VQRASQELASGDHTVSARKGDRNIGHHARLDDGPCAMASASDGSEVLEIEVPEEQARRLAACLALFVGLIRR